MQSIPTINQLYTTILSDLEASVQVNIPLVGKSFLRGLAIVQAGVIKMCYLYLGAVQKNIFVDNADSEANGGTLERWGRIKLGRNPYPPIAGQYTIAITGTTGGIIKANQTFISNDDALNPGILYILDNDHTLVSSNDSITVRALTPGIAGKLNANDGLTATSPIALVDSAASVLSEAIQPLDGEDLETYRNEVVQSFRLEAQGGSSCDYRLWSQDAQGVKNSYPYTKSGAVNEINLYIEAILTDSTDGKGTPTATILNGVTTVINQNPDTSLDTLFRGRRPANDIVNVLPINVRQVDIIIDSFQNLDADTSSAILSQITSFVNTVRPFVAAIDALTDKNDLIDSNNIISQILTAKPGSVFGSVTIKIDNVENNSFQFLYGDIPYLNSVTYS